MFDNVRETITYQGKRQEPEHCKELGNLIRMRELGITELKVEDGKNLCASIEKMEHLCSLYVNSASKEEYLDLNYVMISPQLINSLILGWRLDEIPAWICKL